MERSWLAGFRVLCVLCGSCAAPQERGELQLHWRKLTASFKGRQGLTLLAWNGSCLFPAEIIQLGWTVVRNNCYLAEAVMEDLINARTEKSRCLTFKSCSASCPQVFIPFFFQPLSLTCPLMFIIQQLKSVKYLFPFISKLLNECFSIFQTG